MQCLLALHYMLLNRSGVCMEKIDEEHTTQLHNEKKLCKNECVCVCVAFYVQFYEFIVSIEISLGDFYRLGDMKRLESLFLGFLYGRYLICD